MRLIDADALLKAMEEERQYLLARGQTGAEHIIVHHCLPIIDNAPTIDNAYQEGHIDGMLQAEKIYARPQGDLNNAIMTIKAVCEEHNTCVECPMNRNCNEHPAKWEEGAR